MKAVVVHAYGGPEVLRYEDAPDPIPGPGEVLVRVAATSINPFDGMRRSGAAKAMAPIQFPGIVGVDVAGTVAALGAGVGDFAVGDRVFGMGDKTYAELCVVKATSLAKIPDGIDTVDAAALPLVTTTGNELIVAAGVTAGQTVLVAGALGGVGRSAVFTAKELGTRVTAAVLASRRQDAPALGADAVVATDDAHAIAALAPVDAVASAIGGRIAETLIGKVRPGGVFATTLDAPANAGDYPTVRVVPIHAAPDRERLLHMSRAVRDGRFVIPIDRKIPLAAAREGTEAAQKGVSGKILLTT